MKIIKFITGVSKKLGKVKSWRLPWKSKAPPTLPERPLDEERPDVKQDLEEKAEENIEAVDNLEEENEVVGVEPILEEVPSQPTRRLDPVQEAEPPGRRKALLIGIQSFADQMAEAAQESPVEPSVPSLTSTGPPSTAAAAAFTTPAGPAGRATPSFVALSSLALATTRAKAKFMQKLTVRSRLPPSTSSHPSSSALPPPAGTATESCAAAVLAQAGLSNASSALPVLGSAAPASLPAPATPQTGGAGPTPSAEVPLKPGESLALQEHGLSPEKLTKEKEKGKGKGKEREKEKKKKKKKKKSKKEKSGNQHERSTGSAKSNALRGCHQDVEDMEKVLVELYGYSPSDITTMTDSSVNMATDSHLLPTRDNIIEQIRELVKGAAEGDKFFFLFAGHSTQEETDSPDEEDGKDELIVTYDYQLIRDDELRQLLVNPLPPGVKLIAVFDSCHSASLLDLEHHRCNRVWVPWINKGKRRSLSLFARVVRKAGWVTSPRRRKRRDAATAKPATHGNVEDAQGLEDIKKIEAKELEKAQEGAQELRSEVVGNVPEGAESNKNSNTATVNANAGAGKENVKPKPPMKRAKIFPVHEGSRESSLDRAMVGRGSGSSELAAPSGGGAARPISILATGATTAVVAARTRAPSSEGSVAVGTAQRPSTRLPPIKTISLHSNGVPTRPATPVQNGNAASVTFTPQSSRRGSLVAQQGSRRSSVQAQQGMIQVLEKPEKREKGDRQRTDMSNKTDQSDGSYPASDVTHGSGGPWFFSAEPEEMGDGVDEEEDKRENAQSQARIERAGPSPVPFLGAPASLAMGAALSTTAIPGHAISPATTTSGSTIVLAQTMSSLEAKTREGGGEEEREQKSRCIPNTRYPRRVLSPEEQFCDGWCMRKYKKEGVDRKKTMPFVISLSAAKDGQRALEDESGASMTRHLVKILEKEPAPSLERLLGLISHELHATYLSIHPTAREYRKKAREVNKKRLLKGKAMRDVADVEMNNFQDPQISSLWPLDMKNELWDP